jgi:hypothetical protein
MFFHQCKSQRRTNNVAIKNIILTKFKNFWWKEICPLRICSIENIDDSDIGFGTVLKTFRIGLLVLKSGM